MFKKLFHKHEIATFSCTLEDIGCPEIRNGWERLPVGHYRYEPYPKNALVIYKKCSTCEYYDITISDGATHYEVHEEYVLTKVNSLKKHKEEKETERLLNIGNPDYEIISKKEEEIQGLKQLSEQLKSQLHVLQDALKKSQRNDDIWASMNMSEKRKLAKKYNFKVEEII